MLRAFENVAQRLEPVRRRIAAMIGNRKPVRPASHELAGKGHELRLIWREVPALARHRIDCHADSLGVDSCQRVSPIGLHGVRVNPGPHIRPLPTEHRQQLGKQPINRVRRRARPRR